MSNAQSAHSLSNWVFHNRKRIVVLVMALGLITFPFEQHTWFDSWPLHEYVSVGLGWTLVALGCFVRLWATAHIFGRKSLELVTTGPYRMVRNPLYVGSALASFGACLITESIVLSMCAATALVLTYGLTVRHEEKKLTRIFGQNYLDFCRKVPRLAPNFGAFGQALRDAGGDWRYLSLKKEWGTCVGFLAAATLLTILEEVFENLHASGVLPSIIPV